MAESGLVLMLLASFGHVALLEAHRSRSDRNQLT